MDIDLSVQSGDDPTDLTFTSANTAWTWTGNNAQQPDLGTLNTNASYVSESQAQGHKGGPSAAAANRASVPVACQSCRSRHLKCNGTPGTTCTRCSTDGTECTYIKSRRGWKGPRRKQPQSTTNSDQASSQQLPTRQSSTPSTHEQTPPDFNLRGPSPSNISQDVAIVPGGHLASLNGLNHAVQPHVGESQAPAQGNPRLAYITKYFDYFAPAHPILPDRERTYDLIESRGLSHLDLAIQYVGCRYVDNSASNHLRQDLDKALHSGQTRRDGFAVQALLLYAIGLHANDMPELALKTLHLAIELALHLGMNQARFVTQSGGGNPVLEESWRRTWWELFVLDAFFAGVNKLSDFRLRTVQSDVPVPCEESFFRSGGEIPPSGSYEDYESAAFEGNDEVWSSFTYKIHAAKVLGGILQVDPYAEKEDAAVDRADLALSNWQLNLPDEKKSIVDKFSRVDEVLLEAHMIIASASIMLHRPRSALEINPVENIKTCVSPGEYLGTTQARELHTVKAMQAAEDLSKLMRLPSHLQCRSPFFTCAVVMASVVHLSYWSFIVPEGEDGPVKDLIRLDTGALKQLSAYWPIAGTCLGQVKAVAHEMFASKKALSLHTWDAMSGPFERMIEDVSVRQIESG